MLRGARSLGLRRSDDEGAGVGSASRAIRIAFGQADWSGAGHMQDPKVMRGLDI
jgi:hypothetical protein